MIKVSNLSAASDDNGVISNLQEVLSSKSGTVNNLIGIFRKIISETSYFSLQSENYVLVISVAICVVEHKQLRQIASKMLMALAQTYPAGFNACLEERKYVTSESIMFMILYCSDCIKYLEVDVLKSLWKKYFGSHQELTTMNSNKFIFGCRALNAYIGAIEKYHQETYNLTDVVDNETFNTILTLASSKSLNRDCRQVLCCKIICSISFTVLRSMAVVVMSILCSVDHRLDCSTPKY